MDGEAPPLLFLLILLLELVLLLLLLTSSRRRGKAMSTATAIGRGGLQRSDCCCLRS